MKKILIVDDNMDFLRILSSALQIFMFKKGAFMDCLDEMVQAKHQ